MAHSGSVSFSWSGDPCEATRPQASPPIMDEYGPTNLLFGTTQMLTSMGKWVSTLMQHAGETFRRANAWIVRSPRPLRWVSIIGQLDAREDELNERSFLRVAGP